MIVYNKRTSYPTEAILVDRTTKWGNPFVIGKDGTREEVIAKYEAWIVQQPELMAALHELTGKYLVCWCMPEACHGEVLLRLANPELRTIQFSE